jgi:hypothetical protein
VWHVIFYHPQLMRWNFEVEPFVAQWIDQMEENTIIPFPACSLIRHLRSIVPEFYHVLAQMQPLLTAQSVFLAFQLSSPNFYTTFEHDLDYRIP